MKTFLQQPQVIVADRVYTVDLGEVTFRFFEFNNDSIYHVLIRFDTSEFNILISPHVIVKPRSSQTFMLEQAVDRFQYVASSKLPQAKALVNVDSRFWFFTSDRQIVTNSAAYQTVGIEGQVMSELENYNNVAGARIIRAKPQGATYNTFEIDNAGVLYYGNGESAASSKILFAPAIPGILMQDIVFMKFGLQLDYPQDSAQTLAPIRTDTFLTKPAYAAIGYNTTAFSIISETPQMTETPQGLTRMRGSVKYTGANTALPFLFATFGASYRPAVTKTFCSARGPFVSTLRVTAAGEIYIDKILDGTGVARTTLNTNDEFDLNMIAYDQ